MVEVAGVTVFEPGREPFEDLSVQSDRVSSRPQRKPVKIDSRRLFRHRRIFRDPVKIRPPGAARVENAIEIARSPEDVFDYCVDLTREPEWNPKARRVEKISDGPIGVGSRFQAEFLKGSPMSIEFMRFERPLAWETSGRSARLDAKGEGRISATQRGAHLVIRMELTPKGALRFLLPILGRFMRHQQGRNLAAIKQVLER